LSLERENQLKEQVQNKEESIVSLKRELDPKRKSGAFHEVLKCSNTRKCLLSFLSPKESIVLTSLNKSLRLEALWDFEPIHKVIRQRETVMSAEIASLKSVSSR